MSGWRRLRIALLLLVLGGVALDAWLTRWRTTDWDFPLRVSVYPIVADAQPATERYVQALQRQDLAPLETFLAREARRYALPLAEPIHVTLRPPLAEQPPQPPDDRALLGVMAWSLKLRRWANRMEGDMPRPRSQVRIFVLYYDPATQPHVAHSLGLQQGLVGVVHAFASREMTPTNNVVIAHELLHTLGATDKYDPATGLPLHPDGYAEPQRSPRHPQAAAELMAGRIPLDVGHAEIPAHLGQVRIGALTAQEIGWTAAP